MPLFSLIVPTFNAADSLQITLDSIRAQKFGDLEILVQDGGSTDGTLALLAAQADVNWQSAPDAGIYDAMNRAIERARGQFAIFLGAGDTLEPGALATWAAFIGAQRAQSDAPLIIYGEAVRADGARPHAGKFGQWRLTRENVCHQAMAFETVLFERLGLYQTRYRNCADWAWNIRAWGDDGVRKIYVPAALARYEGGGQSESSQDENFNADVLGLVQTHFDFPARTLYTLRRKSPQNLKNLLRQNARVTPEPAQTAISRVAGVAATVSMVIPTYNSGALLKQTLDSALAQTLAPLEIIVVDDGSTDGTPAWVRANYGARVTLITQSNGGVARARNAGWRAASGEWIAFLDHDDVWYPDKLERLLRAATPDCGVIYSRWREINEAGEPLADDAQLTRQSWWHGASGRVFGWLFGWRCPLISMSVPLVRRDLLEQIGGFDARCVPCDDWDLWLRLARVCRFAFADEVLLDYRCYPAQQSRDEARALRAARRVLGKHPWALAARPLLLWWWLWLGAFGASLSAYNAAKNVGSRGEFARAMMRAARAHPLALLAPQWIKLVAQFMARR